jgi:hypothetical protein
MLNYFIHMQQALSFKLTLVKLFAGLLVNTSVLLLDHVTMPAKSLL